MRAPSGGRGRAGGRLGGRYSSRGGGRGRGSFGDTTPDTVEGPTLEFTHSFCLQFAPEIGEMTHECEGELVLTLTNKKVR